MNLQSANGFAALGSCLLFIVKAVIPVCEPLAQISCSPVFRKKTLNKLFKQALLTIHFSMRVLNLPRDGLNLCIIKVPVFTGRIPHNDLSPYLVNDLRGEVVTCFSPLVRDGNGPKTAAACCVSQEFIIVGRTEKGALPRVFLRAFGVCRAVAV